MTLVTQVLHKSSLDLYVESPILSSDTLKPELNWLKAELKSYLIASYQNLIYLRLNLSLVLLLKLSSTQVPHEVLLTSAVGGPCSGQGQRKGVSFIGLIYVSVGHHAT